MHLIPGHTGIAAPFSVYTIDEKRWPKSYAKTFLGCGFSCSSTGHIATCSHVVQDVKPGELLVVQHISEGHCHKAQILAHHPKSSFQNLTWTGEWKMGTGRHG